MSDTDDMWAEAMNEQANAEQVQEANQAAEKIASSVPANEKLALIEDIEVELSVEIGRTRLPIAQVLKLAQGSVVELDVLAGEPLNVYVNGTLVAQGEVVVVNDKFGIRLTDVVSPSERQKRSK